MKDMFCRADHGYTVTDKQNLTLIHAEANCLDSRTDEIVPMTFYYLKNTAPERVGKELVTNLVSLTVAGLGFEFVELLNIETDSMPLNAELIWKDKHEQKALPF